MPSTNSQSNKSARRNDTGVKPSQNDSIGERVRREAERRVAGLTLAGREAITQRLRELDREWNVDRALQTHAGAAVLLSLLLGKAFTSKFRLVTALAGGFMLQRALTGWCLPTELYRRLGLRTSKEIDQERQALKALRGDFDNIPDPGKDVPEAVRSALNIAGR